MAKEQSAKSRNLHEIPTTTKWSTRKKVIVITCISAAAVAIIVIPVVLGVILSRSQATTTTTTQASTVISIYWSLDAVTYDSTYTYNGTLINSAGYFTTTTSQPFVGYGRGLSLSSASSQYMSVLTPYLNLTYTSFTVEAWIFSSTNYGGDSGIFSQCQCSTCTNECFYFLVRGNRLYAGFTSNDVSGSTNITYNLWYHVAFVYNYNTQQQILYVNGVQDGISSNVSAYQGINGTMDIGSTVILSIRSYFNGYIDNVKLTTRAKSSTELLTAATLTAYFSFDVSGPTLDSGPNGLNGSSTSATTISGHLNQAMRFTGTSSYFYAYGFFQVGYGVYISRPFSVSLWINPSATTSCTILQFAYSLSSYTCHNLFGIWSTIGYTGQLIIQGWAWPVVIGPYATIGTWTHVAITYSLTNGLSLYVNGVYFGNTGTFAFQNSGYITYLQLGYMNPCSTSSIPNSGYQGSIDELYAYSRELSQSDVTTLANS